MHIFYIKEKSFLIPRQKAIIKSDMESISPPSLKYLVHRHAYESPQGPIPEKYPVSQEGHLTFQMSSLQMASKEKTFQMLHCTII
jgi:hypothetical protein